MTTKPTATVAPTVKSSAPTIFDGLSRAGSLIDARALLAMCYESLKAQYGPHSGSMLLSMIEQYFDRYPTTENKKSCPSNPDEDIFGL